MSKLHKRRTWQALIFGINFLLILVTAAFPHMPNSSLKWSIFNRLNLAAEMNIAVWWASSLLLLVGIVAYELSNRDLYSKMAWMILAIVFSLLSFDEMGSIHERIGNLTIGLAVYVCMALLVGSALVLAIWVLWRNKHDRYGLLIILTGMALILSAAPNEYLEQHVHFPSYLLGARVAFEEGLELFGTFACLIGITRCWAASRLRGLPLGFFSGIESATSLKKILLTGFVIHVGIAWISVHYIEIGYQGNPAVWFFMAIFYCLAVVFFLEARKKIFPSGFVYLLVGGYFMTLSASSMYFTLQAPSSLFRGLGLFGNPNLLLGFQLLIAVGLNFLVRRGFSWSALIQFFTVAIVLGWSFYLNNEFVTYLASGLFSLVLAVRFLPVTMVENNSQLDATLSGGASSTGSRA